jgi:hypothetical protein
MSFDVLKGWWTDAGTFESLHRATTLVRQGQEKAEVKVKAEGKTKD